MSVFNFTVPDAPAPSPASTPAPGKVSHVAVALSRLCQQWRDKPNVIAVVTALATQTQSLEDALWDLLTLRSIDTATGSTLDALGKLVGQPRNGLSDLSYRPYIKAKVATNKSQGVPENLIAIAKAILNDTTKLITVERQGVAAAVVRITPGSISDTVANVLITFLRQAPSAGVQLILETPADSEAETFYMDTITFATGATSIGGTSMPADTTGFPATGSIVIDTAGNAETVAYLAKTASAFQLTTPLTKNHASGVQVTVPSPPGKGWGDSASPGQPALTPRAHVGLAMTGGLMIDARQ